MKRFKKIISVLLVCTVFFCTVVGNSIFTNAETNAEKIARLKKEKASDAAILEAIQARIAEINAEIASYNSKIYSINATIEANNAEIKQNEADIETDKLAFKKRIRSIYMSDSESTVKILLGAESFSQYLQLEQLTSSVSSHDKKLIEDLVSAIEVLNQKNAENQELLDEQVALRSQVESRQAELKSQEAEAQTKYSKTSSDLSNAEAAYKAEQEAIAARARGGGSGSASTPSFINDSGAFKWPCTGFTYISAGYHSNDSVHNGTHYGIDIAGGGISGTPIRAISDGYVSYVNNSCSHNYGKWGSCGCGGGYGNYCQINHGTIDGNTYSAIYGHAASICVSPGQYVQKGQVIGYVGTTGWSTGYHLHLGVWRNGSYINPLSLSYAS